MRIRHLMPALCAIALFGELPGERVLRDEGGGDGGGGGGGGGPPVPTVPSERRAVQLPGGELAPDAATEDARVARAFGALERAPAAPPAQPPAPAPGAPAPQVSKLDTSAPATPAAGEPPAPPAAPAAPPEGASERQSNAGEFAAAIERVTARERELAELQRRLDADRASLARYAEFEKTLREEDAVAALEKLGVTFDDISRAAVEKRGIQGGATKIEKEIQELRGELKTLREERAAAQRADLERRAREEIGAEITKSSPLLGRLGERAREEVFSRLALHFQQTGEILPTAQAISAVERDYSAIVTHALADETLRTKFLGNTVATPGVSDRPPPVTQATPTITNEHASELPARAASDVITEEEREARALRHLGG